jgi:pyruvate kinase
VDATGKQLLKYRRTKIVATLGPASNQESMISDLIDAGVCVFRLNMSHGTHEDHAQNYGRIRTAAERSGKSVAVLADLCGPKIRVGRFEGGRIELVDGETITVTTRDVLGRSGLVPSQYEALAADVVPGDRILLDDGILELRVVAASGTEIECKVVHGGTLKDRKGMNLPGVKVSAPSLTAKDREDAAFAVRLGVDFLALSFVRRAEDVQDLRALIRELGREVPIISKIEKPEALDNICAIVDASDAIMVARGDLGVELPPQQVPNIQEELVDLARARNKPVIVATQMLESMMENARPTRAEVTDVANAVRSGADAVMLSGETAAGKHPLAAVRMMDTIVRQTESYLFFHGAFGTFDQFTPTGVEAESPLPVERAFANATAQLSRELMVRGIVVITGHGRTMSILSSSRPAAPLLAVSPDPLARSLGCLTWGVVPAGAAPADLGAPEAVARKLAQQLGLANAGDRLLMVRGFGSGLPSVTIVTV